MVESNAFPVPGELPKGPKGDDILRAKLQELTEFIRDLKQRVESRREQDEEDRQYIRQIIERWKQDDVQSKAAEHDIAFEEHQKRMKEYDARMAESDARIDELMRDNRRRIEELERRWGIGGSRDE